MRLLCLHKSIYIHARARLVAWRDRSRQAGIKRGLARHGARPRIEIRAEGVGLFAQLYWCLVIWDECAKRGVMPELRCMSANYGGGAGDWLSHLCGRKGLPSEGDFIRLSRFEELPFFKEPRDLSFSRAHQLVRRHLPIAPSIHSRVEAYAAMHLAGRRVLGVHYRGTDKWLEANRTPYDGFLALVCEQIAAMGGHAVFLATDEARFVEALRAALPPDVELLTLEHVRSEGAAPVHQGEAAGTGENPFRLAEEALIDVLLLARCERLLKTPSMLSGWAKVFNPDLPVCLVGEMHRDRVFWPDSQLRPGEFV